MMLVILIRTTYTLLAAIALLFELVPWTREAFVKYGKTRNRPENTSNSGPGTVAAWFAQKTVPKSSFAHFYSFGIVVSSIFIADLFSWSRCQAHDVAEANGTSISLSPLRFILSLGFGLADDADSRNMVYPRTSAILAFGMYTLHIILRLKESLRDQPRSSARIHIGQFGVGIIFYAITPLATFIDSCYRAEWRRTPLWLALSAIALYAFASLHQWRCHHILFRLRSGPPNRKLHIAAHKAGSQIQQPYSIPTGDLFDYISSPHYLCEILIYASLWMLTAFQQHTLLWTLFWTAINLGITSRESHLWYCKTFGSKYPRHRRALLPFIW